MKRQPVNSTNLASVGYDVVTKVLEIEFSSGGIYQYTGVPATVYTALMTAESHGRYFATYIRDTYPTHKIR